MHLLLSRQYLNLFTLTKLSRCPLLRMEWPALSVYTIFRGSSEVLVQTSYNSQPSSQAGTYPWLHACCRTITFPATPTSVALYALLSSRRRFPAKPSGLVSCISCGRSPAIYIGEIIEKNFPGFPVAEILTWLVTPSATLLFAKLCSAGKTHNGSDCWRCAWFFNLAPIIRTG